MRLLVQCQSMDKIQSKNKCNFDTADANSCPLNFILMIVRYYIFKCAMKGSDLNVYQVQEIAKEKFIEQELLSKINNKSEFKKNGHFGKVCFQELKKTECKKTCCFVLTA